MKVRFESYFDPKAHPKTAQILLELLKRTKSLYGAFESTPPNRIIFGRFEMPNMLYAEVCDALRCSCSLMHAASDGSDWIVVLDATHLAMSDAEFERLNKIVNPELSTWDVWVKLASWLADHQGKIFSESHLSDICGGQITKAYTQFRDRNPYVHLIVKDSGAYYVYIKP